MPSPTDPPAPSPDSGLPDFDPIETEEPAVLTVRWPARCDLEDAPFWKEVAAFNRIPQSQVDGYYGKYIAVYQGNIVDADPDEGELALRFYRTFGYVPVYIHRVGVEDGLMDFDE